MIEIQVNDGGLTQRELIKFGVNWDGLAAAGIDLNLPLIKKVRAGVPPEPLLPPIDGAVQVYEGDGK